MYAGLKTTKSLHGASSLCGSNGASGSSYGNAALSPSSPYILSVASGVANATGIATMAVITITIMADIAIPFMFIVTSFVCYAHFNRANTGFATCSHIMFIIYTTHT